MRSFARVTVSVSMMLLGVAVAPKVAEAQAPATAPTPSGAVKVEPVRLDHRHQTGLALMPGIGYRVIVPYQENKPCGDSSRSAWSSSAG